MPISTPDCDVVPRLPAGATNAACVRCGRILADGSGPRQWIYCDRREHNEEATHTPVSARSMDPRGQATATLIEGLGRYTIGDELGRGGMGLVLGAYDTVLERHVALKVQISGPSASETARKRFAHELHTLAALKVDGVARVLDGGVTAEGMAWYVMERIEGPNLSDVLLDAFMLPRDEALRIVGQLARTMSRVHQQNVAHRDIKPSNILLTLDGHPVLVDFGLVTTVHRQAGSKDRLTVDVVGTPQYMAPEQNTSDWDDIDWVQVDVYALGMVLIECLTGALPPVAYPTLELLPPAIRHICETATHPDPRSRYATPAELADAIDRALNGGWRPSASAYRWAAGIAGAVVVALTIPAATVWSDWREQAEREAVAQERLLATWERIALLDPNDPDIEATFQAYVQDASNHGTHAYHRAWRRRAEQSVDPDHQIESWATAWLTAESQTELSESLHGLVDVFMGHGRWHALDALLADSTDAELEAAGLDAQELRIQVALQARRFDEALTYMSADDPRHAMAQHLRTAVRIPELDDVLLVRPHHGWVCGPDACIHQDGRTLDGPIDLTIDGGHLGPLFHRAGQGLFREDGSVLCEVDLPHLLNATEWNGKLALAAAGQTPQMLILDPQDCSVDPLPIANSGLDTWIGSVHSVDLDGEGPDELVVALGPSLGYGLRAISADGTTILDHQVLGNAREMVPVRTESGLHFIVALSSFHISPYFFPVGAPSGVALVSWTETGFGQPVMLPHPLSEPLDAWLADSADIDGDGDNDVVATHASSEPGLTVWLNEEESYLPLALGGLSSGFLRQLDDDPEYELIATASGEGWILGLGDGLTPARSAPAPMPHDTRPLFSQALQLRRLGLLRRSAEEAERAARTLAFTDAIDAWELAAKSWLDAGEPTLAARAYSEAAAVGGTTSGQRALDAYVDGWALAEAREFAIRTGLPSRAPTDYVVVDLDHAPEPWMWLARGTATWSATRGDIAIDGVSGMEDVLRFEVERRSDVFGARVQLVSERLEWGAGVALYLQDTDSPLSAEVRLEAHGGDGELYRRITSSFHATSIPDGDPLGPHDTTLMLAYDRHRGERYAEGWSDGERLMAHQKSYPLAGDRFIVSIRLPHHPQVDGAVSRTLIEQIELFGLVPTGRMLTAPEQTATQELAALLAALRRNPTDPRGLPLDEYVAAIDRAFRAHLQMHPLDRELIQTAANQLDVLASAYAREHYPLASVLYADALVASGRLDDAESVYRGLVSSPSVHAACLAWAGLADSAAIRGQPTEPYIEAALALAPNDTVGRAWLRRRRLGPLID